LAEEFGEGLMRKVQVVAAMVAIMLGSGAAAFAGPWEDGMVAYNRGDYLPAMKLFRPLAQAGNAKAQNVVGVMYRKGEGVVRSPAKAFMWFSLAAKRGDGRAKASVQEMSKEMSSTEMAQAREMMVACEVSDYRNCAY
jgi:TPR repeat protein